MSLLPPLPRVNRGYVCVCVLCVCVCFCVNKKKMIALVGNVTLFGIHIPKSLKNYFLNVITFYIGLPRWHSGKKKKKICQPMQETQETHVQSLSWEDPPGEGKGNPLQFSCLGNSMDRRDWQAIVHGIPGSQKQMSS